MAIFHLSTKIIKRSDGRSSVGASAYRSASKMIDNRTGKSFNYTKKRGVLETGCMMRDAGALIDIDRAELWNVAERVEKRKDSRTAREFVMALPHELDHSARKDIVERFCRHLIDRYGVAVDWAMHAPDKKGDDKNYHAHILMTTRTASITNDGMILLGEKTDLELANKDLKKRGVYTSTQQQIKDLREFCATITNNALKDAKIDASVDHRSHKDRNLKTVPTIKMGFKASALERKGVATERGDINRAIRAFNDALNAPVPAPTPKPKPAPKPASAPIVHHTPAPTVTNQFIDDFAQAFADELANEYESFAFDKTEPAPPPPPKPAEPAKPANNDSLDSKHSIQQSNKAQATEILRLPASFFYSDTAYGVKVMAEIGHYGRYAQGSESLGRVGIHEFDSRSLLRTTFEYDATNQKIVSIGGLGAYLRERIPNDAKQRENVENAMIDGLQKRAQFLQENNLDAYEQHIKSTLKTHFNVEQSATAERTAHQRNNDRDFDR